MTRTIGLVAALIVALVLAGGIAAGVALMQPPAQGGPLGGPPPFAQGGPGPRPGPGGEGRLPPPQPRRFEELAAILVTTFVVACGIAIGAWILTGVMSRSALRPLEQTTVALEALASGDFSQRVVAVASDERASKLAHAYNSAAETVARLFDERRAAVRESQRFLADAGHELRTPLTIVAGYIDILRGSEGMDGKTFARVVDNMHAESNRMRALVEKMLLLARIESTHDRVALIDFDALINDLVDSLSQRYPQRSVSISGKSAAMIHADPGDVGEAFGNLVENALKYAPESPVEIALSGDESAATVSVTDYGPGIVAADRDLVFQRFYRGQGRGLTDGAGLGLAIAQSAAQRWKGAVQLLTVPGQTTFVLRFPKAPA